MSYSLPSPWRLCRLVLRLDTFSLGECSAPLFNDVERGASLGRKFAVAMNGQRPEHVAEFVNEFKEGRFLYWRHGVDGLSVLYAPDVTHSHGVVVSFGVCPQSPNGSPTLYGAASVVQDDEVVPDVRPITRGACVPLSYCFGGDMLPPLGCGTMEDNFARLHEATSCLSHNPTARKNAPTPDHHFFFKPSMSSSWLLRVSVWWSNFSSIRATVAKIWSNLSMSPKVEERAALRVDLVKYYASPERVYENCTLFVVAVAPSRYKAKNNNSPTVMLEDKVVRKLALW